MAIPFAPILGKVSTNVGKATDEIEDQLLFVNDKLYEINSIDFCNPLGYIMGKALPPDGPVQKAIDKHAGKLKKFVDMLGKLDLKKIVAKEVDKELTEDEKRKKEETIKALIEIKNEIDRIEVPVEFSENIPGADKINKKLQEIKVKIDVAEGIAIDAINPIDLIGLGDELKAVKMFLLPFTSPQNVLNAFFGKEVEMVNKILKDFIRPDKLAEGVEKIIQLVVTVEAIISKIIGYMQTISTIIKIINILIKIYIVIAKLLKRIPIPARYTTVGTIVKAGTKSNEMEFHKAEEIRDFLKVLSNFLDSVIVSLAGVRGEIITMIVALEQLKQNLSQCPYTQDNYLDQAMSDAVTSAKTSLSNLEKQVPQIKNIIIPGITMGLQSPEDSETGNGVYDLIYLGYGINVEKEELVDQNISIIRRYANIFDPNGDIKGSTNPTYASNTAVLFNEAKFIIDGYDTIASPDSNDDTFKESDAEEMLDIDLKEQQLQANEAQAGVTSLVNSIAAEKDLADKLEKKKNDRAKAKSKASSSNDTPNPKKVREVAILISSMKVSFFKNIPDITRGGSGATAILKNRVYTTSSQRASVRSLIRDLGGAKKANNLSIVNSINKVTISDNFSKLRENRDDLKNITVLINFLKAKKYTPLEIQYGLQKTGLSKKFTFSLKKGNVKIRKKKKFRNEAFRGF